MPDILSSDFSYRSNWVRTHLEQYWGYHVENCFGLKTLGKRKNRPSYIHSTTPFIPFFLDCQ